MATLMIETSKEGSVVLTWKTRDGDAMRSVVAKGHFAKLEVNTPVRLVAETLSPDVAPVVTIPSGVQFLEVGTPGYGWTGRVFLEEEKEEA